MIIDRADRFGLAQLHQLRGRVGRSHHRAFAYLVAPPKAALSGDAAKRLEAIESLEDLGAGFALATQDLEIRGAGELLGDEQSGQISEIGFTLYLDLLERAIKALRSGQEPDLEAPLHSGPEVDLHVPVLIPEAYMPDVHLRLVLYKRIAAAADDEALDELAAEMVDRFGPLPAPIDNLVRVTRLKLAAAALGLKRFDVGPQGGLVEFAADHRVDPAAVLKLVQKEARTYRLDGPNRLRHSLKGDLPEARFKLAGQLLAALGAGSSGKLPR
jgi:transcription-repair coupling factor (superfamily II helicase)